MKKIGLMMMGFVMSVPAWAYSLTVTSPSPNQIILYPSAANTLGIKLETGKPLSPLDTLYVHLDGQTLAINQTEVQADILGVGLGHHTLVTQIKNEKGQVIASDTRAFNITINPAIPQKVRAEKELAQKKAEYDALPWYKKAKLKLTQDDIVISSNGFARKPQENSIEAMANKKANASEVNAVRSIEGIKPMSSGFGGVMGIDLGAAPTKKR